ncbi:hypothetical protein RFI_08527 [Reticulomyxa filosa]|uniref:Uncharacterized protein n=1 Tax=Reticulomyxa filosa TaxID=46433 RepID=X6NS95_RETFI|nr:hypothetical protein RFI_08527 [Reticulomyxa filosa]|eukprot:ETO28604.1 hypothetical protein RFI_08527 [Reticulomyxa filosa]
MKETKYSMNEALKKSDVSQSQCQSPKNDTEQKLVRDASIPRHESSSDRQQDVVDPFTTIGISTNDSDKSSISDTLAKVLNSHNINTEERKKKRRELIERFQQKSKSNSCSDSSTRSSSIRSSPHKSVFPHLIFQDISNKQSQPTTFSVCKKKKKKKKLLTNQN